MSHRTSISQRILGALVPGILRQKDVGRPGPRVSVVVIVHDMQREAPRTLHSVSAAYQERISEDEYEVIVVENGSRHPLEAEEVLAAGDNFSYHRLQDPPPSPAFAINYGVEAAKSKFVCILIDGACLVTPGVLSNALRMFRAFPSPIVMTRYFYLGPGCQNETINDGYNAQVEDDLLAQIEWPQNGYRLFEIGTPLRLAKDSEPSWFHRPLESNCLFVRKTTFTEIGGCDESFNIPGGGLASFDLLRRLTEHPDTSLVQLVGEGTFHQLHGGTTTNTSPNDRDAKVERYKQQYEAIRGYKPGLPRRPTRLHFFGRPSTPVAFMMQHRIGDGIRLPTSS